MLRISVLIAYRSNITYMSVVCVTTIYYKTRVSLLFKIITRIYASGWCVVCVSVVNIKLFLKCQVQQY